MPRVTSELSSADRWGTLRVRSNIGRMDYTVAPGLYALGQPEFTAPVLVTANYKLSFDTLRSRLPGRNAWILVLDTHGINVWCAAGKGTFGTDELVRQIRSSGLEMVVKHRQVIVPQLGAPGVAAYRVKDATGFTALFGPIRADDLPAYLDGGKRATPEMRQVTFPARDRAILIPVELVSALQIALPSAAAVALVAGLGAAEGYLAATLSHGLIAAAAVLGGVFAGAVLTPLALPWLPGHAFATKGALAGIGVAAVVAAALWRETGGWDPATAVEALAWLLLVPAIAAFLAMNFTGSSTFTSLSGVRKEMAVAVPLQAGFALTGALLWMGGRWLL